MGNPLALRLGMGIGACAAVLLASAAAAAAGRLLVEPGSSLGVAEARVAQALAPNWRTVWVSVRPTEPGRFALLLPVPAGTAVDPALGEWLEALDQATATRVLPPVGVAECGATTGASSESTAEGHLASAPALSVAVLVDANDAPGFAASQGFGFSESDALALASTSGSRLVAIVFQTKSVSEVTQTIRLSMPIASSALGLRLLDSTAGVEQVTLFTIAEGRASIGSAEELEKALVPVTWKSFDASSDYVEARRSLLESKQGGAWLIDSTSTQSLYSWSVLPNGAGAISPAVQTYFEQAQKHGESVPNTTACLDKVYDARTDGQAGARVSRACAPGLLAQVPWGSLPPTCVETPGAGESPSAALRCGEADDLAYALSGLRADAARLSRQSGVVATQTPASTTVAVSVGSDVSPVVHATEVDSKGCVNGNGSGGVGGAGGGGWGQGGGNGIGGSGGSYYDPGYEEEYVDSHTDVQCGCTAQDSESCSRESSGGEGDTESCGGDSSSAEDEGDTCSGDSSDSTAEEGETCAGDSTDSSEGGADTCSGDSASDSEGDTCSGSSSDSSSGGDTCSSGSSGSGGGDCALGRGRKPRVRLSVLTLLLTAFALPLRRLGRRRRSRT